MLDESAITAGQLMTRDVAMVHPDTPVAEAAKLMAARGISGMPVVDRNGALVGTVSEVDLLRWHEDLPEKQQSWLGLLAEGTDLAPEFLEAIRAEHRKVENVMGRDPVSVAEDTPAREVARLIVERGIKRVPVLRDGKVVGIVSRADLVRAFAAEAAKKPAA